MRKAPLAHGGEELAADSCSRGRWRVVHRVLDGGILDPARRQPLTLQQVEQAALRVDVVVRQVNLGELRVVPTAAETVLELGEQLALDHPVDLRVHAGEVLRGNGIEHPGPQVHHPRHLLIRRALIRALLKPALRRLEGALLHLERSDGAARCKGEFDSTCGVGGDVADVRNRIRQFHVRQVEAGLQHLDDQQHRADLQGEGGLGHVGIAHDHVHAAEAVGISVGFVAGVDDRSGARGGGRNALPHLVCALGDDELVPRDLARAADQLASDQKRQQLLAEGLQRELAADQVVLVRTVGVPARIHVVFEQVGRTCEAVVTQRLIALLRQLVEDPLPRLVVGEQLAQRVALRGRVLRVRAHIQVQARSV